MSGKGPETFKQHKTLYTMQLLRWVNRQWELHVILYLFEMITRYINSRYYQYIYEVFLYYSYCIQTPQAPMVRPYLYDYYNVDNYPLGTNAVVAVISYTVG